MKKMFEYLDERYKASEVIEKINSTKRRRYTLEELHPNAPKKIEHTRTKRHEDYFNSLMNKQITEKFYGKMMIKATSFDQELYKKYHKAYSKISDHDADFMIKVKTMMNSSLSPDEKWSQYKKFVNQGIKNWNKKNIENPNKQIEELGE